MTKETVSIDLGARAYDIHIGAGLLDDIVSLVPFDLQARRLFIVTDENVGALYGEKLRAALQAAGADDVQLLALPAGEETKSFAMLQKLVGWMLDHGVTRQSVLFTLGGGVIGDLGGFAASIVMRGIPFVQVPTSLLAMVDSAVGGKTAIDVPQGKNLVGTFYQPCAVIADLDVLSSLPRREGLAGYAEIVKYGLIDDPEFFIWLEHQGGEVLANAPQALRKAIGTSCRKKAEIVREDEREGGRRAVLNLGHTFGHALETVAGYDGRLLHGEAVAIGSVLAFALSVRIGQADPEDLRRIRTHFEAIGLPTKIADIQPALMVEPAALVDLMARDKKATTRGPAFILARGIGKAYITDDVNREDLEAVISQSL